MSLDYSAPDRAAKRPDLPFLRRRSRPVRPANSPIADFVAGRASGRANQPRPTTARTPAAPPRPTAARTPAAPPRPTRTEPARPTRPTTTRPAPATAAASSSLDLSTSLDLGGPPAVPPVPAARAAGSTSLDLDSPAPSSTPAGSTGSSSSSLDLSDPPPTARRSAATGSSTSLDLSGPAPASRPATASGPSTSLDLGAAPIGVQPARAPASSSTSLDLSAAPAPAPPAAQPRQVGAERPVGAGAALVSQAAAPARAALWTEPRTSPGVPTILSPPSPTVTLTRVQSGVGTLIFEAVASAEVGDLRLGCAYQLRSGLSSTVQHQAGRRFAPPGETRRPLLLAARGQYERISMDLRQVTDLERLVIYGFAGNDRQLRWGGTLVITTFGGDRIELPIDMPPASAVAVLASVYNIRGQLVLRSEMDLVGTTIREAARGYGFDRITWLDEQSPID